MHMSGYWLVKEKRGMRQHARLLMVSEIYLVRQLQHVGHSYPSSTDDEHDQQGTGNQLRKIEIDILMNCKRHS